MPRANNAALEKRERRFYGVRMYVAMRVCSRVVHSPMQVLLHLIECPRVNSRFIGHNDFHMTANIGIDNLPHSRRLGIFSANQSEIAIALPDSNDYRWVTLRTPTAL